jgi:hypothetical protein
MKPFFTKIRTLLLALSLALACTTIIMSYSYMYRKNRLPDDGWKKYTTPLTSETTKSLCEKFSISESELCKNNKEVYAPDFFPIFTKNFQVGSATYQEVQTKLAEYQFALDPVKKGMDGKPYFISRYDLRGDGVTSVAFFFNGDYLTNVLDKIAFDYGDPAGY